jgi:hypothetical protein
LEELEAAMIGSAVGDGVGGLIVFIIWLVVLVWIYNIAKRKGRHAVLWTILGVFFTIITLVVILVLPSKRTTSGY